MPSVTFDQFDSGMDLRNSASTSKASKLRDLKNGYITSGKSVRKRPGMTLFYDFNISSETGTKGLVAANGFLNVFISELPPINIAGTYFKCHRLAHPSSLSAKIQYINNADTYYGLIYVAASYDDNSTYHHYLNIGSNGEIPYSNRAWTVGEYVTGVANDTMGLRWRCTNAGTDLFSGRFLTTFFEVISIFNINIVNHQQYVATSNTSVCSRTPQTLF